MAVSARGKPPQEGWKEFLNKEFGHVTDKGRPCQAESVVVVRAFSEGCTIGSGILKK
ncbi:MAG: hypothetical protein LBT40_18510 [Deltaproteobacteria bacterium]|nr:hypothetical protein [Deltaproteobacteria bacterium]